MNRRIIGFVVVALPVLALAGTWVSAHRTAQQGVDWDVPVRGYDPRDLLRGHYIRYEYDWPYAQPKGEEELGFDVGGYGPVCLIGKAPVLRLAKPLSHSDDEKGCDAVVRPNEWRESDGEDGAHRDRLFVPQTQAAGLESRLRDEKQQGVIRIRVRADGVATPQSLSFRPRPPGSTEE